MASEARLAELEEKFVDKAWRLRNLYWIQDEDGRKVQFVPNEVQQRLLDESHGRDIIPKSRQHGISTLKCIDYLDDALWVPGIHAGIIADTQKNASKLFRTKVLYALDAMYEEWPWVAEMVGVKRRDLSGELEFSNGSSIYVSVSHRGGTLQRLHISEYGPMCAYYPQRAQEVKTGALNTVHSKGRISVESTVMGTEGDFARLCKEAEAQAEMVRAGEYELGPLDFKLHFFAWWEDPKNTLDTEPRMDEEYERYFSELEGKIKRRLTDGQKAWYIAKSRQQGEQMKQEHPSTLSEAFEQSIEGAYLHHELAMARREGRITNLPIQPGKPVHTFWDLGHNDINAIWFAQQDGAWFNFIDYYENVGASLAHYAQVLVKKRDEFGIQYANHHLPHDVEVTDISQSDHLNRKEVLETLGIKPIVVVERIERLEDGIEMMRQMFPKCRFDKTRCEKGLNHLANYRKKWNEQVQAWSDTPVKNNARNAADALRQCAQGFRPSTGGKIKLPQGGNWRVA